MTPPTPPLLILTLLLLGGGCGNEERAPRTGIPDTLMVRGLIDVHAAAAHATRTGQDPDSLRAAALGALGLDTTAFERALDAYSERPQALLHLYDRAIAQMLLEHGEIDPLLRPPQPLPD